MGRVGYRYLTWYFYMHTGHMKCVPNLFSLNVLYTKRYQVRTKAILGSLIQVSLMRLLVMLISYHAFRIKLYYVICLLNEIKFVVVP